MTIPQQSKNNHLLISYRQTLSGKWLVFMAEPYKQTTPYNITGEFFVKREGYTTSFQIARFDTEAEAKEFAEKYIATQNEKRIPGREYQYVPWTPPIAKPYTSYADLPPKYPNLKKKYSSFEEARKDGWIQINPSKMIAPNTRVIDVTPGRSFGYDLVIINTETGTRLAKSHEIWVTDENGRMKFSIRFRTGDVVDAIKKVKS